MSIASEYAPNMYSGNGSTYTFPFTFNAPDKASVVATKENSAGVETTLIENTNYKIINWRKFGDTGSVSLGYYDGPTWVNAPLSTGETLTLSRHIPLTQTTDLVNQQKFLAESVERSLDKVVMQGQQTSYRVDQHDARIGAVESANEFTTQYKDTTYIGTLVPESGFKSRYTKFINPDASGKAIAWDALDVKGVTIKDCEIENNEMPAFHAAGEGQDGTHVLGTKVTSQSYGILLDVGTTYDRTDEVDGPNGGQKFSVIGCDIESDNSDPIEMNGPGAEFSHTILALNYLKNTSNEPNETSGLGIGIAATKFNVVLGNNFLNTINEAIHVEDTQESTVIVANVGKTRGDGIRVFNDRWNASRPISIVGNSFKQVADPQTSVGIHLFWQYSGAAKGPCVVGNVVNKYDDGIRFGAPVDDSGPILSLVDNNSVVDCNNAMASWGASNQFMTRQYGDNYADNCPYFFKSHSKSAMFGRVHSRTIPTAIFNSPDYGGFLPSRCDGFSFPFITTAINVATDLSSSKGLYGGRALFPLTGPLRGRLKVWCSGAPPNQTHWCHYSADLHWDGTTMLQTNIMTRVHGNLNLIEITSANDLLYCNLWASVATSIARGWVEFDGEMWDA